MMTKNLTVIITMAGLGSRFRNAGYNCPKYMIKAKGKTLFEWSMDSLAGVNEHVRKYVFVVRAEDHAADFIREKCAKYGLNEIDIVEIDYLTDGQASTCMLAIPYCSPDNPILVYNIDTYVEPYEIKWENITGEGYIPCFHGEGNHWSFVKLDEKEKVTEVREKERISDNCTLGAYYFSSAKLYTELYTEYCENCGELLLKQPENKREKYIAPLYNLMIRRGLSVTISIVDVKKVHVLGTPEELKIFLDEGCY